MSLCHSAYPALVRSASATDQAAAGRTLRYTPTEDRYIKCHNGDQRYTRALYVPRSAWRVETSDMPIFGIYKKGDCRNIHFTIETGRHTLRLDSVADCTALYRGGERVYHLSDPAWGKGRLTMTVVTSPDKDQCIWQVKATNMPKGAMLTAYCVKTAEVKMSRNGDLGADPADCFAPHPQRLGLQECSIGIAGKETVRYIVCDDAMICTSDQAAAERDYQSAQRYISERLAHLRIDTPDPYINAIAPSLTTASDALWDGQTYLHGVVGWRTPLCGWRGAYTGDFLGWHDRARSHFDAYAASQVTDVPMTYPHPTQDTIRNLARADKRWGTPMYSNGYICRNPGRNDQMHHYDMDLCYVDELLWHILWTGDLDYARKTWPVVERALKWEKQNYDPDDDGLYDAYCCIWASDALYYNSGAVTHSTAYNYRANRIAAEIAQQIGVDPAPYHKEAEKIRQAANQTLWIDTLGTWAEYRDLMGHGLTHTHPGVWTIYHAIDSDLGDARQAYSATGYITDYIPHIPLGIQTAPGEDLKTISTTDWQPYTWSINNVAHAEVYNTALAYWQSDRSEEAYNLLKSAVVDGMYMGASPGNIGQISQFDAARGECYRDFGDPIGVLSRTLVQGLLGITPDCLNGVLAIQPGWPQKWDKASFSHPDVDLGFDRDDSGDHYKIKSRLNGINTVKLRLPALRDKVNSVKINGQPSAWVIDEESIGQPYICITIDGINNNAETMIDVDWDGMYIAKTLPSASSPNKYQQMHQDDMTWWVENRRSVPSPGYDIPTPLGTAPITSGEALYRTVDMSQTFNANITDIFSQEYLSPRSPYTTLQIPTQGIGDWCHPDMTAEVDDTALRTAEGRIHVAGGIPFATPTEGPNVAYTSLFDNYPESIILPLSGQAAAIDLLMVGSTNHMQCYTENARVDIRYADGETVGLHLVPPYNWCPIEQDYYTDNAAFRQMAERPVRLSLKDGWSDRHPDIQINLGGPDDRRIPGGAATMLALPLDPNKELKDIRLTTIANDVVIGLVGATLVNATE